MGASRIRSWSYSKVENSRIDEPLPSEHRIDFTVDGDGQSIEIGGVLLDGDGSTAISPVVFSKDEVLHVEFREQRVPQLGDLVFDNIQFVNFELEVDFHDSLPERASVDYVDLNENRQTLVEVDQVRST